MRWDFNSLSMAAAIYLGSSASRRGEILYSAEDPTGRLATVVVQLGA